MNLTFLKSKTNEELIEMLGWAIHNDSPYCKVEDEYCTQEQLEKEILSRMK